MGALLQDARYAFRMLAKSPGFTLVAILTLALGIGANAAIFSVTDQVLLRLLPVQKPEELVVLRSPGPNPGRNWSDGDVGVAFSYPMYKDLRDHNPVFSGLLARFAIQASVSGQGQTELAKGELVSGNYFEVLGVRSALGRVLTSQDETVAGANPETVLSYGYWERHFGRDPGILNKQLVVNGVSMTVVGVVAPGFFGVQVGQTPDIFIPVTMKAQMTPNWDGLADRKDHWLAMLGRLKPGMSLAKAEAGIAPEYAAILQSEAAELKLSRERNKQFLDKKILLDTGSHGRPILQHDAGKPIWILMSMVGLVLLIACANLASLLVARGEGRQREIAVRMAMGAGRWRLIRQLLTESLLISLAGGAAGLLVGSWTLGALVGSIPESLGAQGLQAKFDYRVLLFALGISILTGLLFGLIPALRSTSADLQSTLREQGANVFGGKSNVRLRKVLLVSQVALTVVLLAAAGFFAQSLMNLKRQNLGVKTDHVIQFAVAPELNRYTPEQTVALADRLRENIAGLPGVRSVSVAEMSLLSKSDSSANITAEGYTVSEDTNTDVQQNWIGPHFFATLGIPLLSGRELDDRDTSTAPKVAIVNEQMAQIYFHNQNPIGRHFAFGAGNGVHPDIEIIGVVKDSKNTDLRQELRPFVYIPYSQDKRLGDATFYVRTNLEPTALASALLKTVQSADANLPVFDMKTLDQQVDEIAFSERLLTFFSLCLGLLAALLAAIGLYGVMAYMVAQRTREIGIRMALGATQKNVAWLVLREIVRISAAGLGIGLVAAFGLGKLIESQLFGVKASNPLVFLTSAVLLSVVALLAGWLPARKAASVDPMVALRYE
ncbi:MAG TPA: ABC transporter permease [Candidatus Acidoferrales bacterium]|jgi:predicted permease|nr:ABC transporter permease [Candidatus Acidoferrales bacterium]